MDSFFFIPASKLENHRWIQSTGVEHIIVDFEDAIIPSQRSEFYNQLSGKVESYRQSWLRIPVYEENNTRLDLRFITQFITSGYTRFVLPKLKSYHDFQSVCEQLCEKNSSIELVLLVEHPRLLVELRSIMSSPFQKHIVALGLGSHDLLSFIGAEHSPDQTFYPRMELLYMAKAYGKISIDIASMNVSDKERFDIEIETGALSGYDAKFLVHPNQYTWLKENKVIENRALAWAKDILQALPEGAIESDIEPFILNGDIIEKPHVDKAIAILKKYEHDK